MNKKSHNKAVLLISLTAALFLNLAPQAEDVNFIHIAKNEGLSQNTVYSILQDRNGFMWFGTENGLNRYDGYDFTVFNPVPGDPSSISHGGILNLYEDRAGFIWIGTLNGGLNRYDPHSGEFRSYRHAADRGDSLSNDIVYSILEDRDGALWIGTNNGLNRLNRATGKFTRYLMQPERTGSGNPIYDICEDRGGGLWIGSFGGGVIHMERGTGKLVHYRHDAGNPASLGNDFVNHILQDRGGTLWVGTVSGLNRLDRKSGRFALVPILPAGEPGSGREQIFPIIEDWNGTLWVGFQGGLARLDGKTGAAIVYRNDPLDPQSLGGAMVFSICEDRSGILWIGTDTGGISQFNPSQKKFSHYRLVPGKANTLGSNIVHSFWEDPGRVLWIGTRDGLDRLDRNTGSFTHFGYGAGKPESLGRINVRSLKGDHAGNLWLGTNGLGLQRFDRASGKVTIFKNDPADPESISNNIIMAIEEDPTGALWIGTYGGGVNRMDADAKEGRFTRIRFAENDPGSLSDDLARAILVDRGGTLWVGTYGGGLNRLDRASGKFVHYRYDAADPGSLSNDYVFCLHEDSEGVIWVGTLSGGLNRLDRERGTFVHFTQADGLASNMVLGILEDIAGNLWLTTGEGLSRFSPREKRFRNYDTGDGIQGKEFFGGSVYANRDGEMFIGGANGFNVFSPLSIVDSNYVPPLAITSFKVLNREVTLPRPIWDTREIVLSPKDLLFSFEFATLDFAAPAKNRYAYKLEGLTDDWIQTDARHRSASFSRLPPGKYVFRVKGSNSDGVWNEKAVSLVIHVRPPWWRSWWFLSLVAVTMFLLLFQWNRTRFKRLAAKIRTEAAMDQFFSKYNISAREKEIAILLLKGKNNKEIADLLFIELSTVKNHIHNIFSKLGVRNRAQLLRLFQNLQIQ